MVSYAVPWSSAELGSPRGDMRRGNLYVNIFEGQHFCPVVSSNQRRVTVKLSRIASKSWSFAVGQSLRSRPNNLRFFKF